MRGTTSRLGKSKRINIRFNGLKLFLSVAFLK